MSEAASDGELFRNVRATSLFAASTQPELALENSLTMRPIPTFRSGRSTAHTTATDKAQASSEVASPSPAAAPDVSEIDAKSEVSSEIAAELAELASKTLLEGKSAVSFYNIPLTRERTPFTVHAVRKLGGDGEIFEVVGYDLKEAIKYARMLCYDSSLDEDGFPNSYPDEKGRVHPPVGDTHVVVKLNAGPYAVARVSGKAAHDYESDGDVCWVKAADPRVVASVAYASRAVTVTKFKAGDDDFKRVGSRWPQLLGLV
jgi:hypothetical protein